MTYEDAIAWWYGRIDYERRTPVPGDLKLDQIRTLLARLGDPHQRLRIVHIAGSKGKGSTSAMLASILRRAGYRVGLFTSPHLCQVEERVQVDGEPISKPELASLLTEVRDAATPSLQPTFFEVATAVGFLHFVRRRVEIAIVEVGLGGRFDSTNICSPLVSIITSISYDHTKILGDTLAEIAFEKAGILKPGVPAISGVAAPEASAVIDRVAAERACRLVKLGRNFSFTYLPGRVQQQPPSVEILAGARRWPPMRLGLLGPHQAANAGCAVACIEELQRLGLTISDQQVAEGLARVEWPARLEVLSRRPWVVLDCAHNLASVHALLETLAESFPAGRRFLIFASSSDKDVPGMLRMIAPHFQKFLLTRYTLNQRAVPPEELAAQLKKQTDSPVEIHVQPGDAWRSAMDQANPDDLIVISGSVFLAGELRPTICNATRSCTA